MVERIDEKTFQEKAEGTIREIENALSRLEDEYDLEVDNEGGALKVLFEEPPGTFVITPNGSARQIWVSALATSFKLDWSEEKGAFVFAGEQGPETLRELLSRLVTRQLGSPTPVLV